ncbi:hypothetical protein SO802_021983 [Lithocarpus litseifolius]|uniref:Protein kinase domain-containing protein n=1 Tax=Lithocarpus litseifolius TaxID=425828 RepID=A0AAW2CIC8_9ROSI
MSLLFSYDNFENNTESWVPARTERDGFREAVEKFGGSGGFNGGVPTGLKANVTLSKDGSSGSYKTVQEAVNGGGKRFVIRIKVGVKKNVVFLGDGIGETVITGSLNVGQLGIYNTATVEMEFSVKKYSWRELEILTDSFSEENFIGNVKHGKVYRGKTKQGQEVTVKIWFRFESQNRDIANRHANYSLTRLESECTFLTHPDGMNHPNLVQLIGYCCEVEDHHLGVVYDLRPKDTLLNLIDKDDLNWNQMQVALAIARVLEYLHCHNPLYQLRFVHPALIMLDQDSNPVLFDFFMLSGGIVGDKQFVSYRDKSHLCYLPYLDIYYNGLGFYCSGSSYKSGRPM